MGVDAQQRLICVDCRGCAMDHDPNSMHLFLKLLGAFWMETGRTRAMVKSSEWWSNKECYSTTTDSLFSFVALKEHEINRWYQSLRCVILDPEPNQCWWISHYGSITICVLNRWCQWLVTNHIIGSTNNESINMCYHITIDPLLTNQRCPFPVTYQETTPSYNKGRNSPGYRLYHGNWLRVGIGYRLCGRSAMELALSLVSSIWFISWFIHQPANAGEAAIFGYHN